MQFQDEFECEVDGRTFNVYVEGKKILDDGYIFNHISHIEIWDDYGEMVGTDEEVYTTIYEDVLDREFELEIHSRDFDAELG